MFSSVDLFSGHENTLLIAAIAPAILLALVLLAPLVLRSSAVGSRSRRVSRWRLRRRAARWSVSVPAWSCSATRSWARSRRSRSSAPGRCSGSPATCCWSHSGSQHQAGLAAAAAVLFAVNITAALPATPANLGVFQAACAAVLHAGWHVGFATGVAYGVILQAVEVATAILMGAPALLKEGMSWREVRMRAMHATPVKLPARPQRSSRSSRGSEVVARPSDGSARVQPVAARQSRYRRLTSGRPQL